MSDFKTKVQSGKMFVARHVNDVISYDEEESDSETTVPLTINNHVSSVSARLIDKWVDRIKLKLKFGISDSERLRKYNMSHMLT